MYKVIQISQTMQPPVGTWIQEKNWKYMYSVICFLSPFFILLFYGWQLHLTVPMCESQPSLLLEKKDMDDMTSPKAVHLYGIISVPLVFFYILEKCLHKNHSSTYIRRAT